jgi:hypothetical protein
VQFGEGELRSSVDCHEEIQPSFLRTDLSDIDVEVADGIGLELTLLGFAIFNIRQPRDTVALEAAMQ